ncbi:MAG: transposase, partial [Pseudomonadales bacterium]
YAVMSNHYHVVLYIDSKTAQALSRDEILLRWSRLFSLPSIAQQHQRGDKLNAPQLAYLDQVIEERRNRLMDISWFMRCLNEPIARAANREDSCKGHFWESRFKSQALLDEQALLTCMAYVDLNPIRAGIAEAPEHSDYTSIQQRIRACQVKPSKAEGISKPKLKPLDASELAQPLAIHFDYLDYLQLVDSTGRVIREDKRGHIPEDLLPIFVRLQLDPKKWFELMQPHQIYRAFVFGAPDNLVDYAQAHQLAYVRGSPFAKSLYC